MLRNPEQEEAIRTTEGPLCIVAVPGSGKTTTLIRRIHHMISKGAEASSILMLTFSRAAAMDMSRRYLSLYGANPGVVFSTIHAFCLNLIKMYGKEQEIRVLTQVETAAFARHAAGKIPGCGDLKKAAEDIMLDISIFRGSPSKKGALEPCSGLTREQFYDVIGDYESFKEDLGAIDYDDMLSMARDLLNDNAIRKRVTDRFRYILVDEHQDTNELQWEIIRLLAGDCHNICVVGDDDQSIYGFRGADPSIMLSFKKDFPEGRTICLKTNYRSDRKIVDGAGALISHNRHRFAKKIDGFPQEEGRAEIDIYPDRLSQIKAIAGAVENEAPSGNNDTAILVRTHEQGIAMAEELMDRGIPFFCRDALENKYDSFMLCDFLSFMKAAEGDPSPDDVRRVLSRPDRGLNHEAFRRCPFNETDMRNAASVISNRYARITVRESVARLFADLRALKGKSPREALVFIGNRMGYRQYLSLYAERSGMDSGILLSIWESYQKDAVKCGNTWEAFLRYAADYGHMIETQGRDEGGVVLTTLHGAKGLEWRRVFIIDCVEGYMPHTCGKRRSDTEEERRLLYVGMTRAKEELHLCAFERSSKGKTVKLSPFLKETSLPVIKFGDMEGSRVRKGLDVRRALAESALI